MSSILSQIGQEPSIPKILAQLFSLISDYEEEIEDLRLLLSNNPKFYLETAFNFLIHFNKQPHHIQSINSPRLIDVFDLDSLSNLEENITKTDIQNEKIIKYENILLFLEYNDIADFPLQEVKSMLNFVCFSTNQTGLSYDTFIKLLLPRRNNDIRKNCLKRKIIYDQITIKNSLDSIFQTQIAIILEEELLLYKKQENLKVNLIQECRWDPCKAFQNIDFKNQGYLDFDCFDKFMKYAINKFNNNKWLSMLSRVKKNDEDKIYFDEFKKMSLCNLPYKQDNLLNIIQNDDINLNPMERVNASLQDQKYSILRSSYRASTSNRSVKESPSKIRYAVFDDNDNIGRKSYAVVSNKNNNLNFSALSAQKDYSKIKNNEALYNSYSEGKNMYLSHIPKSKIIKDLYGEHKFMTNTKDSKKTNFNNFNSNISNEIKNENNLNNLVVPQSNFESNHNETKRRVDKLIYSPIRNNPSLLNSINQELKKNTSQFLSVDYIPKSFVKSLTAFSNFPQNKSMNMNINKTDSIIINNSEFLKSSTMNIKKSNKKIFEKDLTGKKTKTIQDIDFGPDKNLVRNNKIFEPNSIKNSRKEEIIERKIVNKPTPKPIF